MIVAVRHPRPAIDPSICYGRLDVGLAEPVEDSARSLVAKLDTRVEKIVSSPLQRAHVFASALAQLLDCPLVIEPRIQEIDFGAWEGVAWSAIAREKIDAWAADPLGYAPGGGESVHQLLARVAEVWRESAAAHNEIWVTHAGPMRCLAALSQAVDVSAYLERRFAYGELLRLRD